mmetsp:Transcript_44991/g.108800  ORF Transcript_44991/g.108800 Transcript_44991/m.108800 type:complete len:188 (+) Transcript_44991:635-1198(+)
MGDLDKNIGDLDGLIKDTEGMIVGELEEAILEHDSELRESFLALSELDCLLAFASCAVDLKFTRPQMEPANHNRIIIKDGRHPLQEIITETEFIPNNAQIDNTERLVVLSGPNYSGKSCYLRQVRTASNSHTTKVQTLLLDSSPTGWIAGVHGTPWMLHSLLRSNHIGHRSNLCTHLHRRNMCRPSE